MDEKKQINIDPSMLEILTKTRRKEPKKNAEPKEKIPKLKLRIPAVKNRVDQSFKSHALKFIRNKQQSMYNEHNTPAKRVPVKPIVEQFNTDFDSSIHYLNEVSKTTIPSSRGIKPAAQTLRVLPQHPQIYNYATPVSLSVDETNISVEEPKDVFDVATPVKVASAYSDNAPKYGCLKNGSLPTYRMYNKTLRNTPQSEEERKWNLEPSFSEWMKKNAEMQKVQEHLKKKTLAEKENDKLKERAMHRRKMKKTIRRTYVVGRSSVQPKVSVLVSNRTIRRDIDIKCNKLKQAALEDVKRDLIKKGFIKVGTSAPPDVLRKMYESVNTLCGDVKNHNADNLVYNFFNDDKKE